ncbi:MAG: hypothetical protein AB1468_05240, partial [Candidatus Micrarchaeota archaeon]
CPDCFIVRIRMTSERRMGNMCTLCGVTMRPGEEDRSLGKVLCRKCLENEKARIAAETCAKCGKYIVGTKYERPDGKFLCAKCRAEDASSAGMGIRIGRCRKCGRQALVKFIEEDGTILCERCSKYAVRKEKHSSANAAIRKLKDLVRKVIEG